MHNYPDTLIQKIIKQLDADGHYDLVTEILKVKHFTKYSTTGCACKGWGCRVCCSSEAEIRGRQGTFG